MCYKLLENPELGKATGRELLLNIFKIIGLLVRYFNTFQGYCSFLIYNNYIFTAVAVKLVSLLSQCEYFSLATMTTSPLAEGVITIVEEGGSELIQSLTKFVFVSKYIYQNELIIVNWVD